MFTWFLIPFLNLEIVTSVNGKITFKIKLSGNFLQGKMCKIGNVATKKLYFNITDKNNIRDIRMSDRRLDKKVNEINSLIVFFKKNAKKK